jgi:UDPglucose 6-dehydrogenase
VSNASSSPRIVVAGLWHLGCVTAACCATRFDVIGLDCDAKVVAGLDAGHAPLHEPGLDDLIAEGMQAGRLRFSTDPVEACAKADLLWLTYDTPVDEDDRADVAFVLGELEKFLPALPTGALVLLSSQLPVGTCAELEARHPQYRFACSPENLRLGKAIDAFTKADRAIVGVRRDEDRELLETVFRPFAKDIIFMRPESAEMVKHALNAFLALSVTFINEIGCLCEATGADAREVSAGLKSDVRIGPRAYLGAGGAFAGGTLARDVVTLSGIAARESREVDVIPAIKRSNDRHRQWPLLTLRRELGELSGRRIAVLGLTYTPNTDTLRRSAAVELCRALLAAGASVRAFDPAVKTLPEDLAAMALCASAADAVRDTAAIVVCTPWPVFRSEDWQALIASMSGDRVIVDADRFLERELVAVPHIRHISVGRSL